MASDTVTQSLVISVDFGTTFSGIAWALADGEKNVHVIKTWPGAGNKTSVKIPTVIAFLEDRLLWGWQAINFSQQSIHGLKLLLDESQSHNYKPSLKAKKILEENDMKVEEVAIQFFKKLLSHTHDILERRFGSAVKTMPTKYVLTVPAVWSDKAKNTTSRVAISAGMSRDQLTLVSEPEAAALYTLRSIQPNTIKNGDTFLICDAGGGTVDLISYRVRDLSPLSVEEVVGGSGGVCGSMILDERFEDFLKKSIGFQVYESLPERTRLVALRYWQNEIKPQFTGIDCDDDWVDISWQIPLPGVEDDPSIELQGGYLQLNKSQIKSIFDPVVQDVVNLVEDQVQKVKIAGHDLHAILLVGGFGACEYLYRRLCRAYPRVTVMQPPDAWQAIACGAVLRGLESNQIQSRIARYHYGVVVTVPFDPYWHRGHCQKYWCKYEEDWKVGGIMDWLINKGTSISEDEPIHHKFYNNVGLDHSLIFHEILLFSKESSAPGRLDSSVHTLCRLTVDLNEVPKSLFQIRRTSSGWKRTTENERLPIIWVGKSMKSLGKINGRDN